MPGEDAAHILVGLCDVCGFPTIGEESDITIQGKECHADVAACIKNLRERVEYLATAIKKHTLTFAFEDSESKSGNDVR